LIWWPGVERPKGTKVTLVILVTLWLGRRQRFGYLRRELPPTQPTRPPKPGPSALRGGQCGATRTAKARASGTSFSASRAKKASGGWRLWRRSSDRLWGPLLFRGERPDQRDDPADERPSRKEVQQQYGREVRPVPRQKRGQEVEKQRHKHENAVEGKEGDEPQRKEPHRSTLLV
jgi:hypothetical protein